MNIPTVRRSVSLGKKLGPKTFKLKFIPLPSNSHLPRKLLLFTNESRGAKLKGESSRMSCMSTACVWRVRITQEYWISYCIVPYTVFLCVKVWMFSCRVNETFPWPIMGTEMTPYSFVFPPVLHPCCLCPSSTRTNMHLRIKMFSTLLCPLFHSISCTVCMS